MTSGGAAATARRDILTTLHFPQRNAWAGRARMIDRSSLSPPGVLRRVLAAARPDDVVVLDGGVGRREGYVDRLAAGLLGHRSDPPRIVVTDSTWSPGPGRRAALRLMDTPRTTYCVLSSAELAQFPARWGVEASRVAFTPFYWTLPRPEADVPRGTGVFAGGDSLRDHEVLLRAAARLDAEVTVATHHRPRTTVPDNVTLGPVTPQRFLELMRQAEVVAVPLPMGLVRSAGQQTYLNAMVLGKLVVVSDVPGVRDHITAGVTGLIVPPGDAEALAETLRWATDPANRQACDRMRRQAQEVATEQFSPDRYVQHLLDVVEALPT